jgi:hypothetical protein
MTLVLVLDIVMGLFTLVTLPVYIMILVILKRLFDELDPAFCAFSISLGVSDILNLIFQHIGVQFPRWGWFNNFYLKIDPPISQIVTLFTWGLPIVQSTSLVLLSIGRATVVFFPLSSKKVTFNV